MKIKIMGVCNECGKKFEPPLNKKMSAYQKKYMDNEYVRVCCDECIAKNHTLTDEELGKVKTEYLN
jgi:phage terminase large subunit GpA-like protein